jgi:PHD/YefM family antitoxin component YafN of YafNO toxin-antitoxin module
MATVKVGIREFRDNLANFLLESEEPLAITRHGDTVGFYIPARRKRTEAERIALDNAHQRLQAMMVERGITEEHILEDFKKLRTKERRGRVSK